jgi:hypothetical protein
MNIAIPTNTNDICIPKIVEDIPKSKIPTISHSLEINSPTPEIAHSSLGSVQSETNADITGRINERPKDIAKVIVIILRNHSLYPSNI